MTAGHASASTQMCMVGVRPRFFLVFALRGSDPDFLQSGAAGDVHQRIQAELADFSLEQSVEARLRKAERLRCSRLSHVASPVKVVDFHQQFESKLQVLSLGLVESEIDEDVFAASDVLELSGHCSLLSRMSRLNLRRANSMSSRAVLRDFQRKAWASSPPAPCPTERVRAEHRPRVAPPGQSPEPVGGCRPARQLASRHYLSFCIKGNRCDSCSPTFNAIASPPLTRRVGGKSGSDPDFSWEGLTPIFLLTR